MEVKGYKVFNPDWTCRGFQYKVGKTYEENVKPSVCNKGFHFCKQAKDCFNYYSFDPENKVAEVLALGEVVEEGDKCCTNKIHIVREITWEEVLTIVNTGKGNAGLCNTGDCNTGDYNRGNFCTGDFNITDHETGCFCTEEHKIRFFDKESDMTFRQWRNSEAYQLLRRIQFEPNQWVWADDMSDEEKIAHPEHETTGGYLKIRDDTDCYKEWWNSLTNEEKEVIKNIPNFDADKFFIITGIKVE